MMTTQPNESIIDTKFKTLYPLTRMQYKSKIA
jgi:hypothetical protein